MKSKGLVPMEIPIGLNTHLMMKRESAWCKVKIERSREKFPYGVFRRCNLAEPGMAVSGHPPSMDRKTLFNTLRKDVYRGQKESVKGIQITCALVNKNHLDQIKVNNNIESGYPLP
ncbi:hypothetical protein JRO89_XS15G0156000 [Xanthoceras sorbifolium]|uniref:Uncharacterized protein n=1 Tax=Xanthoceras sorbifolium TaxID=99658 RepID=A0ABQ8H2D3_9ROSI|nr:hypothetical protein JRO89_XS15G0156000 [Xanthoceras sorbifolium]